MWWPFQILIITWILFTNSKRFAGILVALRRYLFVVYSFVSAKCDTISAFCDPFLQFTFHNIYLVRSTHFPLRRLVFSSVNVGVILFFNSLDEPSMEIFNLLNTTLRVYFLLCSVLNRFVQFQLFKEIELMSSICEWVVEIFNLKMWAITWQSSN